MAIMGRDSFPAMMLPRHPSLTLVRDPVWEGLWVTTELEAEVLHLPVGPGEEPSLEMLHNQVHRELGARPHCVALPTCLWEDHVLPPSGSSFVTSVIRTWDALVPEPRLVYVRSFAAFPFMHPVMRAVDLRSTVRSAVETSRQAI